MNITKSKLNKIKENTKKYLKEFGYSDNQLDFINDIVDMDRPDVALIKEKICGVYTGKLTKLYL